MTHTIKRTVTVVIIEQWQIRWRDEDTLTEILACLTATHASCVTTRYKKATQLSPGERSLKPKWERGTMVEQKRDQ